MWRQSSGIFGPGLKVDDEQRLEYVRAAIRILNDPSREPLDKARDLLAIPGFGPNVRKCSAAYDPRCHVRTLDGEGTRAG
jgi:hypothetical protein